MTTMTATTASSSVINDAYDRYEFDSYTVRMKVFKLFGAAFTIYDPSQNVAFYSKQKAFKLKEDIRLYSDESATTEVLSIKARQIMDISAAYDVVDTLANEKVGTLKRKGLKSMFKDEWIIMDADDNEIGLIKEDSALMATLRRLNDIFTLIFPQKYHGEIGGQRICQFSQNFNPFVRKIGLDFSFDTEDKLDRRLGIAAAVLLCAIEGRQRS